MQNIKENLPDLISKKVYKMESLKEGRMKKTQVVDLYTGKVDTIGETKSPAQIFTELIGGCLHTFAPKSEDEWATMVCSKCGYTTNDLNAQFEETANDYLNAADILNKMKEFCGEERYYKFICEIGLEKNFVYYVEEKYILNAPTLLLKAIEYLRSGK